MISGFSAADAADATMRASGVMPSSLGLGVAHHDDRGGAVVQRAGVAGGDRAVGPEHRLQRRRASRRWCRRGGRRPCVTTVPSGVVTGVISRSKKPFSCDSTGPLLRPGGELVHLLAGHALGLGHVLGGLAHGDVDVGEARRRRPRRPGRPRARLRCAASASAKRVVRAGVGRAVHEAAHGLDAGGDEHVALAGLDRVGGHADRLQRRRAVAVDGDAGDVGMPASMRGDAGDVVARLAGRLAAAHDHVLDERGGRAAGTLSSTPSTISADRSSGRHVDERALVGPADRACGRWRR